MLYFEILVLHFFYFPKIRSSTEEIVVVFGGIISKPSVLSQLTPGINLFIIGSDVDSSLIIAQYREVVSVLVEFLCKLHLH